MSPRSKSIAKQTYLIEVPRAHEEWIGETACRSAIALGEAVKIGLEVTLWRKGKHEHLIVLREERQR